MAPIPLPRARGFPSQTFTSIWPSAYAREFVSEIPNKRRSPVNIDLIREDILEFHSVVKNLPRSMHSSIRRAFEAFKLSERIPLLHLNDVFRQ